MITNLYLESLRVKIIPFSEAHLTEQYIQWLNDPEITRYSEQRFVYHTIESCQLYMNSFKGTKHGFWAILERETQNHIGTLTTYVNQRHAVADIGILIGEKRLWGHGYGTDVWYLICNYLFDVLNVRKVTAGTLSINRAMLKLMEKLGMVDDGVRVGEYVTHDGEVVDLVFKSLFKDTWKKNIPARLLDLYCDSVEGTALTVLPPG